MIHGMNGMMIIPALSLLFVIVSFFAKIPGASRARSECSACIVLQVFLGLFGHELSVLGRVARR